MKNSIMNRSKNTVTASIWLVGAAYTSARDLATAKQGEIGTTADKRFTAKFDSVATAKAFASEWERGYTQAHAEAPASKPASAGKGTRKGKGNGKAVDFSKVKGSTKSERNKAAHALIIGAGIVSGSEEYNSLWKEWQTVR